MKEIINAVRQWSREARCGFLGHKWREGLTSSLWVCDRCHHFEFRNEDAPPEPF